MLSLPATGTPVVRHMDSLYLFRNCAGTYSTGYALYDIAFPPSGPLLCSTIDCFRRSAGRALCAPFFCARCRVPHNHALASFAFPPMCTTHQHTMFSVTTRRSAAWSSAHTYSADGDAPRRTEMRIRTSEVAFAMSHRRQVGKRDSV